MIHGDFEHRVQDFFCFKDFRHIEEFRAPHFLGGAGQPYTLHINPCPYLEVHG